MSPKVYKSPAVTRSADNGLESGIINYDVIRRDPNHSAPAENILRGVPQTEILDTTAERYGVADVMNKKEVMVHTGAVSEAATAVTSARLAALADPTHNFGLTA